MIFSHKIYRKTVVFFAMLLIFSFLFSISVFAYEDPTPPDAPWVKAVCLYDKTHDRFIVSENMDELLNTSTSAKVMTGLIACEMLKDRLNEKITVAAEMLSGVSGYNMKLSAGEKISVSDLLYGAICGSYNDAAYVLAYICGGSIEDFIVLMNNKAMELGATSTSYTNPIGYPDHAAMVTTLSDTFNITLTASNNALYMEICSAVKHTISATNKSGEREFYNRNALISSGSGTSTNYFNPNCSGMNAGYSGEAGGWSVITLARDNGADYICIALGGSESEDGTHIYAYKAVNSLVNWACKTYNIYNVFEKGKELGTAKVKLAGTSGNNAPYITAESLDVYIPTDSLYDTELSYNIMLDSDYIEAPVKSGTRVGEVRVYCNGVSVGSCELVLKEDYSVNSIMLIIDTIGNYTTSRAFIATLICFAILTSGAVFLANTRRGARIGRKTFIRK